MAAPLAGLKVIELARVLAGPWAGQTLSDLGAEVIKIESPEGDDTRQWGPPFVERGEDRSSSYFHSANRGKASVVVDLRSPEGQAKMLELLEGADILIENFKTGGLAKYGLDYHSLKGRFPELIYCSITGFGQTGPYAHRPGYDFIIQGMSGLMSITGEPDGPPQKHGMAITDIFTGIYSTTAILAAVYQRASTGLGQHIDMALMDCAVAITGNQAMNYLTTGTAPTRLGNAHPNLTPYEVFETSDGHIIIATGNDGQFRRLCMLLGLDDMASDPDYASNALRVANRPAMNSRIAAATRMKTRTELLQACEENTVPAGPINTMEDTFNDPQVKARGMQIELDGVPGINSPFKFSGAELSLHRAAPKLGEDG
ncbi:CaiB/BaiF CoA transferase family protein [Sulfitobacter guttiformis]|uniref:Crotonobetainyl-CoA:carnitine CoA-transferase CaiB-like acyl-CoA transferase n=1 Tax=Sulfitobacter guttiformis TaxID=74349 RepID=A0A420DSZ9_9RHOB|nr:CaiB/BaiF CoA-transferase family protein [Sulfitobacter guttiformis]KIN74694.1 Caib/baif family protein [Sulfitobacter guttiformis KCTC 32187]RKE97269.1 crotonobetainyl-CoA:carnitine CoA-transferase CaiB-like acyl-CoA transferase [Sulfitobacter guttiformis]